MADLLDRQLLFVTGKGGVGRTTVVAGLGLLAASQRRRTLLCEVDGKSDLPQFFETGPTNFVERQLAPNLWAMSLDTESSLRQYLTLQLKLRFASRIGPLARMFDYVATAAPGVREILTVGKLCWEVRERNYDLVVVDAAASGHIVSQLAAPHAINSLVGMGPIRDQTDWMLDILGDPARTGVVTVVTPEEMPVLETIELHERLRAETNVDVAAVAVNRVLPELFGRGEEEVFERLERVGGGALAAELGGPVEPLLETARLAVTMRRTRAGHLERLRAGLDPAVPLLYLPYLFLRSHGRRSTRQVADALAAELGY